MWKEEERENHEKKETLNKAKYKRWHENIWKAGAETMRNFA